MLAGLIERLTYQNVENGYCVVRIKARSHRELVTVVGHAAVISAGEWITAAGDWVNDRTPARHDWARPNKDAVLRFTRAYGAAYRIHARAGQSRRGDEDRRRDRRAPASRRMASLIRFLSRQRKRAFTRIFPQPSTSVSGRSSPGDTSSCQRPSLSSYEMPVVSPGTTCSFATRSAALRAMSWDGKVSENTPSTR